MVDIDALLADALAQIDAAADLATLEEVRIATVGRSAPLPLALRDVGTLPPEERGEAGKNLNIARQQLEVRLAEREAELESAALADKLANDRIDVTLPGRAMPHGGLHVLTQTRREIEQIFLDMGYAIAEGPEVETEFNNFTALNIPEDHPAKADSDTLWVSDGVLLRTHTSPVQVRAMQSQEPPVAIICPGRVYRRDTQDATHSPIFHQVEGLLIDEGVTLAHLKGTLDHLTKRLFGADREIRLRSGFFPFTEPSIEVDVSWGDGWMEILGAGMVDPNVLEHVGYDSEKYTGFAFGVGIERVAMLRHGIPDIRMLYDNDVRFLAQFPA
ncbi:MAG: phenylalanine--tRNA ligase subunit alpha [Actinobacteria bacterium]|nr:phenylalanine--tRNA ligase subunit alpha [Actinomycetota bacterium]